MHFRNKTVATTITFFCSLTLLLAGCNQISPKIDLPPGTASLAMSRLMAGNERFSGLRPTHPDADLKHLLEASKAQHPFAAIVCCSDSRVPPELIFDQGIGDLFVIRTAGNIIGAVELGSIEYAVEHLGVKLVVVMGHENCGAIKAFIAGGHNPGHIKDIVDSLSHEAEIIAISASDVNREDDCVRANVLHGTRQLHTQSDIISQRLKSNDLQVIAARYDLHDYKVEIIN